MTIIQPTWGFWADQFLRQLQAKETREHFIAVLAWMRRENTKARYNPLATTEPFANAWDFNSSHVKNYLTFADGQEATYRTLTNGRYPGILRELHRSTTAERIASEVVASPWGTEALDVVWARNNYDRAMRQVLGMQF